MIRACKYAVKQNVYVQVRAEDYFSEDEIKILQSGKFFDYEELYMYLTSIGWFKVE
jgi:hypothetical protein